MRFLLLKDHYLRACPPDLDEVEWEYKEVDRTSGREKRKRFQVPFYCDEGKIVCWQGRGDPTDIVFEGAPTPMMKPMDAEAELEWERESKRWATMDFIGSLDDTNYEAMMLNMFQNKLDRFVGTAPNVPTAQSGVSREEFEALRTQMAEVMARNAELEAQPKRRSL